MYYVYILKLIKDDKFYIGYTNDLQKRIKQHKMTKELNLIYYEVYQSERSARSREKKLKYYGSAWRALRKRITA